MKTKHLLWQIFGPVLLAVLLIAILLSLPIHYRKVSAQEMRKAAVSLDTATFKNQFLKQKALQNKKVNYVPFFGSSELERMDEFHPSVMSAKYYNYRPFLLGKKGAQSLPQFLAMETILPELKNRKVVFIISPQWFVKQGISPDAFKYYNGSLADLTWLKQANPHSAYDRYLAQRLITLLGSNDEVSQLAAKIAQGHQLSSLDQQLISVQHNFLWHEDKLFSRFRPDDNYLNRIKPRLNNLSTKYNYQKLQTMAQADGQKHSTNNHFRILNKFYAQRVKPHYKLLAGAEKHFSYLQSPEYADLELVLHQLAKQHTQVLFMIQPVNTKWAAYTKLSLPMYYRSVAKIKFQLRQQGFDQIADYSHDGSIPYFMQDTIHIGWLGWVKFNHRVNSFIQTKQPAVHYHLKKQFLSRKWQQLKPDQQNLQRFASQIN